MGHSELFECATSEHVKPEKDCRRQQVWHVLPDLIPRNAITGVCNVPKVVVRFDSNCSIEHQFETFKGCLIETQSENGI